MKKRLMALGLVVLLLCLSACGKPGKPADQGGSKAPVNDEKEPGQSDQGTVNVDLGDLAADQYDTIILDAFGIKLNLEDGWEVTDAYSPNGVNNAIVEISASEGAEVMLEDIFNQCLAHGGVWQQNINWDTFAISKGNEYKDFDTMCEEELTVIEDFWSVMWLYDFGGKNVQFSYNQDGTFIELSFTYATLNYEIDIDDWVPQDGQGPTGWTWQGDHGYINGVWDSEVLPENFPKEIEGVHVEETRYFGYGCDERWMGARVGNLYFEDWDYEQWLLTFDATEEQLAQFEQALADNGFLGEKTEDEWDGITAELTDCEVYLYYSLDESDREGYDWNVYCNMAIVEYEYPLFFEAIELPMFGMFMGGDPADCQIYAYDKDYNEIEYEYDFTTGNGGKEVPIVMYDFDYMGVSREEYDEYIDYLRTLKTEEWTEYSNYYREDDYVVYFKYLDHYIGCYYNFDGAVNGVTFIISPDAESLFW